MKIGIIHSIYKPEVRGGAEVVVENIALGLKNQGDEVFIISVGCKNQKEEIDGLKVYRIKSFNLFNFLDINSQPAISRFFWHLLDMFNIIQAGRVYKILKKEKPALVLMHNLKGLGYLTPLVIKILKIKNIQTVHDMQLIHPSGLLPENEKIGFLANSYAGFNKLLFKSVKVVVFPSEYIKSVYQRYGFFKKAEKIVLGNPISKMPTLPEGGQAATPIGADWGGGRGEFQILFLGQVEEYKGIFDLIEAVKGLAGLPAPAGDFVLNIVGNGSALSKAKIRAQEAFPDDSFKAKIRFWGRLEPKELAERIWSQTDLLVNPSQVGESFGLVIIEAYAHGVPVLVSNKGALPELVKEGETGFVVTNNNWREKIEWCLNHQSELKDLRENCLKAAAKYNLEDYLNKLKEFAMMTKTI
ncbi:MAG: hypothetical protein A3B89_00060 [Candidatus Buchananbacteria bacterium RIFCSPHIGHO2_02_FULL_40_13]|uniref:Glycosyltransferase subfamily 4-like N-terminal domain-containing protein n=1 Tax=Candidatus Buchananbacteria bacterium RIFCSPLOWO2_01_FULL_39_33 TaxID=1797543 RepID=A0A1G1YLZ4_9BACT|nr:MAG: hypothetical protein A3B89_00060 [Candidatus Buchananbacteria bacterium RIFCSPHIGHO2_02_FULL_40_13]OGY53284.1 MAG: hypothetical protein A3A02_03285 [Candidatus Buchananbacteria bacterium RIFCSPLOWO2_01_FULL_39_33]